MSYLVACTISIKHGIAPATTTPARCTVLLSDGFHGWAVLSSLANGKWSWNKCSIQQAKNYTTSVSFLVDSNAIYILTLMPSFSNCPMLRYDLAPKPIHEWLITYHIVTYPQQPCSFLYTPQSYPSPPSHQHRLPFSDPCSSSRPRHLPQQR